MKSSLKFTTIALLLGGVLNMPCLDAASALVSVDDAIEQQAPTILSNYANTDEGMRGFADFADKVPAATLKATRATLREEVCNPDSLPLPFLTGAYEKARAGKSLISFLIGVKTESLDSLVVIDASKARIAELESARAALLSAHERDLGLAQAELAAERVLLKLRLSAIPQVVVEPEDLSPFSVLNPASATLRDPGDLARNVAIQAVRCALGTPDLPVVQVRLKAIENLLRHAAVDAEDEAATTRANSFAVLRSQLSTIATQMDAVLVSNRVAHDAIQLKILVQGTLGTFYRHTWGYDEEQQLLRAEYTAAQHIARAAYDVVFGTVPGVVFPVAVGKSNIELMTALQALPRAVVSAVVPVVISADGLVLGIASSDKVTETLTGIRGGNREFLRMVKGAATLVGSSGLSGFETAELARDSFAPAPLPAVAELVVASGSSVGMSPATVPTTAPDGVISGSDGETADVPAPPPAPTTDGAVSATAAVTTE